MREILERLANGEISVDEAEKALKIGVVENVANVARLDVGREIRRNVPEIIFAEGKDDADLVAICSKMLERNDRAIVSRLSDTQLDLLGRKFKDHSIER